MKKVKYFFTCHCGCGQICELDKDSYIRLPQGKFWFADGCNEAEGKPFKSGKIIEVKNEKKGSRNSS